MEAVEGDAPQQRADDEHAAVRSEDAAELMARLERGDDAVGGQGHRAERDERDALVLLDPEPDQVGAADLGDGGGDEQRDRASGHAGIVAGPRTARGATAAAARWRSAAPIARSAIPVRDSS